MRYSITYIAIFSTLLLNCSQNSSKYIEYISETGSIQYKIDFEKMKFAVLSADNPDVMYKPLIDCSNDEMYCINGPFIFKFSRSSLEKLKKVPGIYKLESKDDEKVCISYLVVKNPRVFGIEKFECRFFNGMPWPIFVSKSGPVNVFDFLHTQ
jgi:hypothetical protein